MGTPKDMPSKALEMGVCFHKDHFSGEHGGTFLSWGLLSEEKNFFHQENFYEKWRDV